MAAANYHLAANSLNEAGLFFILRDYLKNS